MTSTLPYARDNSKVLLVGDVHGDSGWLIEEVIPVAKGLGAMCIIQLGDFSFYWPGHTDWWDPVSQALVDADMDLFAMDGNHENFNGLIEAKAFGAKRPMTVAPRIHYLPRGYRWMWNDHVFMSLGGAYSIDKWARVKSGPAQSWWPEEELTEADVERAVTGGKVDVLLTHDVPWGIFVPGVHNPRNPVPDIPECVPNRMKLRRVVDETQPELLVHGHFHVRYHDHLDLLPHDGGEAHRTKIVGLAQERKPGKNHLLLDVSTLELIRS